MLIAGLFMPAAAAVPGLGLPPLMGGKPLIVKIGLFISNLSGIHEAPQTFDLDGFLTLSWQDQRLTAGERSNRGSLSFKSGEIWVPPLEFGNAYVPVTVLSSSLIGKADGQVTWVQRFQAHLSTRF